jgi:hypothetical protein
MVRSLCRALTLLIAVAATDPAGAADLHAINDTVELVLTEASTAQELDVDVPRPGSLALETDPDTADRLRIEVRDAEGALIGVGGARIQRPGRYSLRTSRSADYASDWGLGRWDGHGEGVLVLWSPEPDAFEPNDDPAAAYRLALGPESPMAGGPVARFPDADQDHFILDLSEPGYVTLALDASTLTATDAYYSAQLEDDQERWDPGQTRLLGAGEHPLVLSFSRPNPAPVALSLTYAPLWDRCEPNDREEQACDLSDGRIVPIMFYPAQDRDWFSFNAVRPGIIALSISGLPDDIYDRNGDLLRGLQLEVRTGPVPNHPRGEYASSLITHGTIYVGAPKPGVYRFALSGRWIKENPMQTLSISARLVQEEERVAGRTARFSMLGIYGESGIGDAASLELGVLAGIGGGRFYGAVSARDIEAAVRDFMGLEPSTANQSETAVSAEPAEPDESAAPSLADPKLAGKSAKLRSAVERLRTEKAGQAVESEERPPEAAVQQAAAPQQEQTERERLQALLEALEDGELEALWRHTYRREGGAIMKRLEASAKPALADQYEVMDSEEVSARIGQRLLIRAIQRLE